MAVYGKTKHGIGQNIQVDDSGGTPRDISGDVRDFSWPLAAAVAEAMGAGDTYEESVAGLKGSKVSITCMMNDVATVGSWTVLGGALGSTRTVTWAPFGATSDYPELEAEVIFTELGPSANLTDVVTFTASGTTTGTVVVGTVA